MKEVKYSTLQEKLKHICSYDTLIKSGVTHIQLNKKKINKSTTCKYEGNNCKIWNTNFDLNFMNRLYNKIKIEDFIEIFNSIERNNRSYYFKSTLSSEKAVLNLYYFDFFIDEVKNEVKNNSNCNFYFYKQRYENFTFENVIFKTKMKRSNFINCSFIKCVFEKEIIYNEFSFTSFTDCVFKKIAGVNYLYETKFHNCLYEDNYKESIPMLQKGSKMFENSYTFNTYNDGISFGL